MFAQTSTSLLFLSTLTPLALGHSFLETIWINNPTSQYAAWDPNAGSTGVPYPSDTPSWYTTNVGGNPLYANAALTNDIICAKGGSNAQFAAPAAPGSTITVKWGQGGFPPSHWGPIIDYIAPCEGPCASVVPANLKFVKIAQRGWINEGTDPQGFWATNEMISQNNTWAIQIPSGLKAGQYVVRTELIALHIADRAIGQGPYYNDGPEFYPQCISITVGGTGTKYPDTGKSAKDLYRGDEPGLAYNIHTTNNHANYQIPGPALWTGA